MGVASHVTKIIQKKNECLWAVHIKFKILMRKVKSLLKQTTPFKFAVSHSLIHRRSLQLADNGRIQIFAGN